MVCGCVKPLRGFKNHCKIWEKRLPPHPLVSLTQQPSRVDFSLQKKPGYFKEALIQGFLFIPKLSKFVMSTKVLGYPGTRGTACCSWERSEGREGIFLLQVLGFQDTHCLLLLLKALWGGRFLGMLVRSEVLVSVCARVFVCVCVYTCIDPNIYQCVYMRVCVCTYLCIHI